MTALLPAITLLLLAQGQNAQQARPGFRAAPALYQQNCGGCHDGKQAASITTLQETSPERVYESLTTGKMREQAAALSDVQKKQIAEFLAARPMGGDAAGDMKKMSNQCTSNPTMSET